MCNKVYTIHLSTTFVESFSIWNLVRKEYVNKNKLNNNRYGRTQSSLYPKNVRKQKKYDCKHKNVTL